MENGEGGEWRMENGEWRVGNGEWRMEDGGWRMGRVENGEGRNGPFSLPGGGRKMGDKLAKDKYSLCAYLPGGLDGAMGGIPVPLIVLFH